jgi:hypothetical protein
MPRLSRQGEFAHQLLSTAPIHDSTDVGSYEYPSAARSEQYFGEMHWAFGRRLLEQRLADGSFPIMGR